MAFEEILQTLTKQLYPTGRAFKHPPGGVLDKLHTALSLTEGQAFDDAKAILSAILPDNDNFTSDDATQWEVRLGLIVNPSVPLADRKVAIIRKMNHPGNISARQHYLYIERQLQAAGFNVWVHENIPEVSPIDYMAAGLGDVGQYGTFEYGDGEYGAAYDIAFNTIMTIAEYGTFEYGQSQYGYTFNNIVANHINPALDLYFDPGINFRSSFFIGGETYGSFANVDLNRESEFRQLILLTKPVNTIAFIFINYI